MASNVIIKKMSGHSGCSVYLCETDNKKYVRKTSASEAYNDRLQKQMKKQAEFKHDVLKVPEVYSHGYSDNLFYFDMQFISGIPFHNYVSLNDTNNMIPIIDKICDFLKALPTEDGDASIVIEQKIMSLSLNASTDMHKYFDYCLDFDWSHIPISDNHGDLTFENILIYRDDVYFIDFLDSFIQTKYVDYAKLLQDVILDWSWRHNMNKPLIKTICLYDKILESLSCEEIDMSKRLLVLNLLRIVPYSDRTTLKYLKSRLHYLSETFGV